MVDWVNQNLSTVAGAGGVIGGQLGADLTAAATLTITDAVHFVGGSAVITTISGGQPFPQILVLVPKTGSTWTLGSSGNIFPWSSTPVADRPVVLWWDGSTSWREVAPPAASVADSALSANVALRNAANTFTGGSQTISAGGLVLSNASTGVIKERGRSVAAGEWTPFTPVLTPATGSISGSGPQNARYALVGKTLLISLYATSTYTLAGGPAAKISLTVPGSSVVGARSGGNYTGASSGGVFNGSWEALSAGTAIDFYPSSFLGGSWPNGVVHFIVSLALEIQ